MLDEEDELIAEEALAQLEALAPGIKFVTKLLLHVFVFHVNCFMHSDFLPF